MMWFISAILVASAIFMFAPNSLATSNSVVTEQPKGQKILFLFPLSAVIVLSIVLFSGHQSTNALIAISFALTGCAVAISQLHRFILPCAGLTAVTLISMLVKVF
ncbi:hypothetical protein [Shewanella sp. Isolate11]|uniref:hypothetical protein n=1 Tax=Shewanella sp. Isolate11 TaxID=2908530 RepID=UPI001EFD538A|nr:hypothetical protein [Shewanella sp. Isolate11]MCG9696032.1 hypothetical protein [Shewanella sp. Isolate11]